MRDAFLPLGRTVEDQALRQPPVFIVGALRSGTTLLRLMLDHHPEICIFNEFEYSVEWVRNGSLPRLDEYYRHLDSDRMFLHQKLQIDRSLSYAELVRSFFDQATEGSGKPIRGGTVHSNFQFLPRFWPNARFIHLVRDPRDVARSCVGMHWVGNVYHGSRYWLEPIQRWKEFAPTLADAQKHQLSYEDLIRNPEAELAKICDFLGVNYSASMLAYDEATTYSRPDAKLIEQWRRKLNDDEIMWVESVCGPLMREFGYEPEHSPATSPSLMRLARLNIQHRTSRIERNAKHYGLPLYVSWQLTKRLPKNPLQRHIVRKKFAVDQRHLK